MGQLSVEKSDLPVVVMQPRLHTAPEQERTDGIILKANDILAKDRVRRGKRLVPIYVYPLKEEDTEILRSQSFLTEGHVAGIGYGSSDMDRPADTHLQRRFNQLGLPIMRRLADGPFIAECYMHHAWVEDLGGAVAYDDLLAEAGTEVLQLKPRGTQHVAFQGAESQLPLTYGHKATVVKSPVENFEVLGETKRDSHSALAFRDGQVLTLQGHPSITKGAIGRAAFESSHAAYAAALANLKPGEEPPLKPYIKTSEFVDTPNSDLIIVRYLVAAATGTKEYYTG